jgi:CRP/FNR family cyclic AMP-dependent transcriptional regulator
VGNTIMTATSSLDPIYRVLRDSPLFHGLEKAVFDDIVGALKPEHWSRHTLVMTPEDTLRRFYVLLKGRAKVINQNPESGREITLFLLGPGDAFNIVSLLDGHRHEVSVETLDEVDVLSAPVEQWRKWMDSYPGLHRAMHQYVVWRMRTLSELASDLALYDTMTRLVHLILRYFDNSGGSSHPRANLIKDLPHDELAHMIGTVRVVVNRLLSELRHEGVVNTVGGELHICNLEKLLLKAEQHVRARKSDPAPEEQIQE